MRILLLLYRPIHICWVKLSDSAVLHGHTCSMLKNALAAVPADNFTFDRLVSSAFAADAGDICMASLLDTNVLVRGRPCGGVAWPAVLVAPARGSSLDA